MSFSNNLDKHLNQIKKGGIKVIIKKIRTIIFLTLKIPFFIISIPSVIIIRLISPWILIRFGEIRSGRIGHFAKELELYLNAQWWRLQSLIDGAVLSIENKNMLSAIISLRHAYETIVHTFNLLKQLEKSLESGNGKKFYNSLLTFLHMATEFYDNLFEKNNDSEK